MKLIEQIKEMNRNGVPAQGIAAELNISISYVYRHIEIKQKQKKWTEEEIMTIHRLRNDYVPFSEIAQKLGRTTAQCCSRYWYYLDKNKNVIYKKKGWRV
jgi:DNA invertase Pin-like site-specific DNA recombinase